MKVIGHIVNTYITSFIYSYVNTILKVNLFPAIYSSVSCYFCDIIASSSCFIRGLAKLPAPPRLSSPWRSHTGLFTWGFNTFYDNKKHWRITKTPSCYHQFSRAKEATSVELIQHICVKKACPQIHTCRPLLAWIAVGFGMLFRAGGVCRGM